MWHDLLAQCSQESIWFRFRYLFKSTTHEMATRFCYIDYDREIAIVAEAEEQGKRKLVGVGRLVADIDHRDADYGVLLADAYQGRGLGSVLMDYCIEICRDWGIEQITVETTPDNARMTALIRNRGFTIDRSLSHDVVLGRKDLRASADQSQDPSQAALDEKLVPLPAHSAASLIEGSE
jgi:acetyltransferase